MNFLPSAHACMERALDGLLPRHCILCGCASGSDNLCLPCAAELPRIGHGCRQCALPLSRLPDTYCGHCLARPPPWNSAAAALLYRFPADQLVRRFKFGRNLACGQVLSQELLRAVRHRSGRLPGCILPVPLHRMRHLNRTFNQSDLLASYLGKGLGIPVIRSILKRRRQTSAQSGLDATERKINIGGAFSCRISSRWQSMMKRVVLVDDVMTTGATLAECTTALKKAGAGRVSVWVAARAEGPHQLA